MTKVSVVIPIYNNEKHLRKCLDSVKNQTLKDIEIICVDNNSKDNSYKILEKYAQNDNRFILVKEEKQGPGAARNKGISLAKGEFLGFIDGDDWISKDFYEKLYDFAKIYEADIACASIKRLGFCHNSYKIFYDKYVKWSDDLQEKINLSGIPAHNYIWNKIYNREKFQKANLKFREDMFFEDIDLSIKMIANLGSLVTVPDIRYYYRIRYGSIVSKTTASHSKKRNFYFAMASCERFAKENNIKLDPRASYPKKKCYKLFGINILKRYSYNENNKTYKLLGFIPFFRTDKK